MAWREAVLQNMKLDLARRANNPAIENFGQLIRLSMARSEKERESALTETRTARTAARTALYSRYPSLAAKATGEELPAGAGTIAIPEGTKLGKVVYDETGQPTYTFESVELDESKLATMYNSYVTEIKKADSLNPGIALGKQKPTPIPTFKEWKTTMFPDKTTQETQLDDDEVFSTVGATEEDISYTMQQEGLTREQLAELLRQQLQLRQ